MQKWNYKTNEYELYSVPEDWYCPLYENDMDKKVNCACCGKEIRFGDGYGSQEIHTLNGLGYSVCEECHAKEWERKKMKENGHFKGITDTSMALEEIVKNCEVTVE